MLLMPLILLSGCTEEETAGTPTTVASAPSTVPSTLPSTQLPSTPPATDPPATEPPTPIETDLDGPWQVVMACDAITHRLLATNGTSWLGVIISNQSGSTPWADYDDTVLVDETSSAPRTAWVWQLEGPTSAMDMCGSVEEIPGTFGAPYWEATDGSIQVTYIPDPTVVDPADPSDWPYDYTTVFGTLSLEADAALTLEPRGTATDVHTLQPFEITADLVCIDLPA